MSGDFADALLFVTPTLSLPPFKGGGDSAVRV